MFSFEDLKKPVGIKATLKLNIEGQEVEDFWIVKFRRMTANEKEEQKKLAQKALLKLAEIKHKIDTGDSNVETESLSAPFVEAALDHFCGWKMSDGSEQDLPPGDKTKAWMLDGDVDGSAEFQESIVAAWREYLNPKQEDEVKNFEKPRNAGQGAALETH